MLFLYHVNTFAYFELKNEFTIGRTIGDLTYSSDFLMSGRHVIIYIDQSKGAPLAFIEDQGSKNPTVLNRSQVHAKVKVRMKTYSLLEVGSQQFILTDSKSMSLDILNAVMDHNMNRPVIKIEKDLTNTSATSNSSSLDTSAKSKQLEKAEAELKKLEQETQAELIKLEQAKDKLMASLRTKKSEVQKKITTLKEELEKAEKLKAEVENKKKVINIKNMG